MRTNQDSDIQVDDVESQGQSAVMGLSKLMAAFDWPSLLPYTGFKPFMNGFLIYRSDVSLKD